MVSAIILSSPPGHSQLCPFRGSAASALMMEAHTGEIVYSQKPDLRLQPASLAKIMTLYLIFEAIANGSISLEEEVVVSSQAAQKKGSTMYLREGEKTQLVELIKGIAIVSGNDACIAVAERLAGTEQAFVERMNQKLQELGLENTRFQTVDGWPAENQYTTAHDMAVLARAYIENHSQALAYHKLPEFAHADIVLHNRNRLIARDPTVDGLKTGHIEEAGYHLVATASRDGRRFIAVIMGAENIDVREKEATQLLDSGFGSRKTVKLFDKGDALFQVPVLNGVKEAVGLVPTEAGSFEVPLGLEKWVAYRMDAAAAQQAPIEQEQTMGNVLITYRDEVVKTIPLLAQEKIERATAAGAKADIDSAAAPAGHPKTEIGDPAAPPVATGPFFFVRNLFLLTVLAVLFILVLVQWIYIMKLRRRISRSGAADSELVKQRLEKFIQKH